MATRWMWLSLVGLFVVSSTVALAVPWVRAGGFGGADAEPAPSPSPRFIAFECVPEACDRIGDDLMRRTSLAHADRIAAQGAVPVIEQAVPRETEAECFKLVDACAVRYRPTNPDEVRQALAAAGYPDAIVRLARPGDPAPPGAVVFAVPIEPACLLGYHVPVTGPSQIRVEGPLPDGTCLPQ